VPRPPPPPVRVVEPVVIQNIPAMEDEMETVAGEAVAAFRAVRLLPPYHLSVFVVRCSKKAGFGQIGIRLGRQLTRRRLAHQLNRGAFGFTGSGARQEIRQRGERPDAKTPSQKTSGCSGGHEPEGRLLVLARG
jgi:hypothetical protein